LTLKATGISNLDQSLPQFNFKEKPNLTQNRLIVEINDWPSTMELSKRKHEKSKLVRIEIDGQIKECY
jgi:hypothetical protein